VTGAVERAVCATQALLRVGAVVVCIAVALSTCSSCAERRPEHIRLHAMPPLAPPADHQPRQFMWPRPSGEVSYHSLPRDVCLMFVTDDVMGAMYPEEVGRLHKIGHVLLGYFDPDLHNQKRGPFLISLSVFDPAAFTQERLDRVVHIVDMALQPGGMPFWVKDQVSGDEWYAAGLLLHEMTHLGDATLPGRPRTLFHLLWPTVVSDPGPSEHDVNPWAILHRYWPEDDTHTGYSTSLYHDGKFDHHG
jgi:hypothetical protein